MKTEIIIKNGKVKVVLSAENDFEKEMIETILNKEYEIKVDVKSDYQYHMHNNHRIEMNLTEINETN